jgi:N-acetylglucosaminyl-diphospho-decaprenol L-rhamnosyltransferase
VTPWAAVIVNYNAGDLLVRSIDALLAAPDAPAQIVVVDNDSRDGSAEAVVNRYQSVVVIPVGANLGYARAANLGIAATDADVVAVLNPDTEIRSGAAAALVGRLEREPDLAAVGPRIVNPDGSTYPSARSIPSIADTVGHGVFGLWWSSNPFTARYRHLAADAESPRDVDWLSGSAVWLRRRALDEVGGWDERYFMYVEDVDLCWRLTQGGWRVSYEPAGTVMHVQGATTQAHPYRMLLEHHRSLWRFADRRFQGRWRVLLGPAAAFLAFRAGMTMAAHAGARLLPKHIPG